MSIGSSMKAGSTSMLKGRAKRWIRPAIEYLKASLDEPNEAVAQKILMQQYRLSAARGERLAFADVGFRKYSEFEEDGILLYLFSLIRPLNRICVDIGAGTGLVSNTANLIINHGWWGHLFDGSEAHVAAGRRYFASHKDTRKHPPQFTRAWITAENVNDLITASGAKGPVDLLSLDVDGMDYWIWKAITVIDPQVVVCETHNSIPPDLALVAPYDPQFVAAPGRPRGQSLAAMCALGREKGYRLVGTHRYGFNAFFVKNGIGEESFPEVSAASCLDDPFTREMRAKLWPSEQGMAWQAVA